MPDSWAGYKRKGKSDGNRREGQRRAHDVNGELDECVMVRHKGKAHGEQQWSLPQQKRCTIRLLSGSRAQCAASKAWRLTSGWLTCRCRYPTRRKGGNVCSLSYCALVKESRKKVLARLWMVVYSFFLRHAGLAQLVARHLAKVEVAGSNPVARSMNCRRSTFGSTAFLIAHGRVRASCQGRAIAASPGLLPSQCFPLCGSPHLPAAQCWEVARSPHWYPSQCSGTLRDGERWALRQAWTLRKGRMWARRRVRTLRCG